MPDLLTHVLVGFALGTLAARRYDWLRPPYVTLAMIGATLPDLNRVGLVVPEHALERALERLTTQLSVAPDSVAVDWNALHTLPGSLLVAAIGAFLVPSGLRRRAFTCLLLGCCSHLALDLLLVDPDGRAFPVLWPLTQYSPPTPGLYSSRDTWLPLVAGAAAALAWYARERDGSVSDAA